MIFAPSTVRYHSVISLKRVVRSTACANFAGVIGVVSPLAIFGCAAIEVPPLRPGQALRARRSGPTIAIRLATPPVQLLQHEPDSDAAPGSSQSAPRPSSPHKVSGWRSV